MSMIILKSHSHNADNYSSVCKIVRHYATVTCLLQWSNDRNSPFQVHSFLVPCMHVCIAGITPQNITRAIHVRSCYWVYLLRKVFVSLVKSYGINSIVTLPPTIIGRGSFYSTNRHLHHHLRICLPHRSYSGTWRWGKLSIIAQLIVMPSSLLSLHTCSLRFFRSFFVYFPPKPKELEEDERTRWRWRDANVNMYDLDCAFSELCRSVGFR